MPRKAKKLAQNAFCKNMRRVRRAKDISQEELARLTGIGRNCITSYEVGKNEPNISQAMKIAQALSCTMDELCQEREAAT